ncbi:MAG: cobyric acid synthase, partial [Coriobacteriia bacterium]|nr:cobyric acid synthase [Coriobacteriia bacterium]
MAKKLMILGTESGAGKSTIVTGLLRVLKRHGFRVSPFKSQNMALNSYVTKDGSEMGRSQYVQAEAAGIEPDVCMNPILLKPNGNMTSQVIVGGNLRATLSSEDYRAYRKTLIPEVKLSLEHIEKKSDIVILEGAGAAYELNLRDGDISNMGMAEIANCPVVLVANIDKGGVFASIAGNLYLMSKKERDKIKGVIINKYRGRDGGFDDGKELIEKLIGIKVLGIVPYKEFDLEGEDSLDIRQKKKTFSNDESPRLKIMVVKLNHISNFTDFKPLENDSRVDLIYSLDKELINQADLVIIPGSKNTVADLKQIKLLGIDKELLNRNAKGKYIMGICGGFQMLGVDMTDNEGVESEQKYARGLGILPIKSVFFSEKKLTNSTYKIDEDLRNIGLFKPLKGFSEKE